MAKCNTKLSSTVFALIIFALLILSVGVLVFVLKGQIQHENALMASTEPIVSAGSSDNPAKRTTAAPRQPPDSTVAGHEVADDQTTDGQSDGDPHPWEHFRLPKYATPLHYDLLLHPNLTSDSFSGNVNITVNVTRATRYFVVHAYKLSVQKSQVYRGGLELGVKRTFLYDPHEYFVVEMQSPVDRGVYKVSFSFGGSLVGSIVGFYKSRYTGSNNETKYLATSKFQPTYARRAFLCFDEPSFKSTFRISLVHEPGFIALSNMPVQVIEQYSDRHLLVTRFETSVPMVTYLSCFIVCDFKYTGTTTSNGKQFRVYSTPHQVNKTEYAVKFGSRVLEYFEDYFGISYPLPKQDMVAIPDFASGAMEHWGLITFRELNLLLDQAKASPQNKQRVATVISHEMAHMWFGNLVTMEWWDDLWLNEGFASYVEYKGVHEQYPEWDMMSQLVTEDLQLVMDLDSTMSSHPIVQPVIHPDEITEIFDDISYGKGASMLRMLEFFVGPDNFRKGISQFLTKHQFKNARTSDLWEELSHACGLQGDRNISSIMNTWTQQMGFPYVTVTRDKHNSSHFSVQQRRFLKNGELYNELNDSTQKNIWSIPLSYITSMGKTEIVWIHDDQKVNFTLPLSDSDWVKFNVNQTGYYLVNYEQRDWDQLIDLLKTNHELLSPSDRSNLLFDAFMLAESGHLPFTTYLTMSSYLKKERHLIPWETAYASFVYLSNILEFTDANLLLKSYIKDMTDPLYKKLGWNPATVHLDNLLQTTIIGLACHSGNEDCLSEAAQLFQNWTQGQEIPSTLQSLVYHYGMSEIGREEHWNYMWSRYMEEESPPTRRTLLYGLAHVRIPSLIHKYLEYAMDDSKIRRQDFFKVLNYIAGNPIGRPFVWTFSREKWPALVDRFSLNDRFLGLAVKKICSYFTTEFELQEMQSFFVKYPEAGAGKRRRLQAVENVQNNIKWLRTYKEAVKKWLQLDGIDPWLQYRLPMHVFPEHYDLDIHPDIENDRFSGNVAIDVRLDIPSDCFLVHVLNLEVVHSEVVDLPGGEPVDVERAFGYEPNNFWVLKLGEKLPVGRYRLSFEFRGNLTTSLKGLYKSSYDHQRLNETRYLVATQFESTHARRAFPCFDEPSFRSTFTIRLRHVPSRFALSNTMVEGSKVLDNGLVETRFEKSLPMVTYLVCLVVCDFEYKEAITENGLRFRVYAPEHNINKTDYALDIGSRIITHFEKYFDVPFPLKKLDMIAIPDFQSGAMENWGLITYSEDCMLSTEETPLYDKSDLAETVSHELAHMWFGDLVTMKWWDDLWLNEGFATYIKVKGLEHVEPTWDMGNQFTSETVYTAMARDCSANSHPIIQNIRKANEIAEMFDFISYSKGASVLRMLESLMQEDFRTGVSAYLKKYTFKNARTQDLWAELSAASKKGFNVTSLMDTWTRQMNYPYVTVKRDGDQVTLRQHHFLADPESKFYYQMPSPFGYVWEIPLTYRTSENKVDFILINSTEDVTFTLPNTAWIKFNVNFTGYYIMSYEESDWKIFTKMLLEDPFVFSPSDRINLLFDSFSLASSGTLDYGLALDLSLYLSKEDHASALAVAMGQLEKIRNFLKPDPDTRELMTEHMRILSRDLLRKFTWNDTGDYKERNARAVVIDMACRSGNYECLTTATELLERWMRGEKLGPNIKASVLKYGIQMLKDEEAWNSMWTRFVSETDPQEKNLLRAALANVRNVTLLRRYADLAANEDYEKLYEYFDVLNTICENPEGQSFITDFVFNNWTSLIKKSKSERRVEVMAKHVFGHINTEEGLKKVQDFYRKHPSLKLSGRQRRETIEQIRNNIRLFRQHHVPVRDWLQRNVQMPWRELRLPPTVAPTLYALEIHPNISEKTFEGDVEIDINITEPTDLVVLHQKGLRIRQTEMMTSEDGGHLVAIDEAFPYDANEFWVIRLSQSVPPDVYSLRMVFSGNMKQDGFGLGRYSYTDKDTEELKHVGLTQFEPTSARKAFPCFDEPVMKAKFKLSVIHEPVHTAVSNMPEDTQHTREDGLTETSFQESVPMSTYLLCLLVSDFVYLETEYRGKKIRTYAPRDRIHLTEHSLNFTVKTLEFFEDFFDITYALPKLDSVSVERYAPNGMEHWGLIVYKQSRFLTEDSLSRQRVLEDVDQVIAHEVAHQWFGNLVTMRWWSDVWLNEGFSTFAQFMALKPVYPEADELFMKNTNDAMSADSTLSSHPIIVDARKPEDILGIFDSISYRKGAALLKMLDYTLKGDFRKGLTTYLKKFSFLNTDTKDLWNELSLATGQEVNISEVMDTWTNQMGFPYVEIERGNGHFTATQHWFIQGPDEATISEVIAKNPYGYMWKIPLVYKDVETGHEQSYWLNEKNATFPTNTTMSSLLKFNPEFMGYYIIKYEDSDWRSFAQRLRIGHEDFSVLDRYSLMHDAVRLANTGRLLIDVPLELSRYLVRERNPMPWKPFFTLAQQMRERLDLSGEASRLLVKYLKYLTSELYEVYKDEDGEFASFIKSTACHSYNEKCLEIIEEQYQRWTREEKLTQRMGLVLNLAAEKLGTSAVWWQMYDRLMDESDADDQEDIADALGSFRDPVLLNRTVDRVLLYSAPFLTKYVYQQVFRSLMRNPVAKSTALDLLLSDWPLLKDRIGDGIFWTICSNSRTMEQLNKLIQFFKQNPEIPAQDVSECIAKIQPKIEWSDEFEEEILSWLRYMEK